MKPGKFHYLEKAFPYIVTAVFLILSIVLITRHEFWSDEVKAWNISIGSRSFFEFIYNMKDNYGHPFLWNGILYFISHFVTRNPESMKIIHLLISTSVCFLFVKYAPFTKLIKILFVFGYFPFHEYSIISRNYAIGVLPILIFCILYKNKYKNIIPLAVALFFIGQAHIYSFIISLVLILLLTIDFISDRRMFFKLVSKTKFIIFSAIILAGIMLLYWELGSQASEGTVWAPAIGMVLSRTTEQFGQFPVKATELIISSYLQISNFTINFRNSNLIFTFLSKYNYFYVYSLAVILFAVPLFLMKRKASYLYALGTLSLLVMMLFVYGGSARHYGFIFIFLIACFWISYDMVGENGYFLKFIGKKLMHLSDMFLILILTLSVSFAFTAAFFDFKYPYSSGKQVAEYITQNYNKENLIIVGYKDVDVHAISAYLDKELYLPQIKSFGRFCPYSLRANSVTEEEIFRDAISFINSGKDVLVVTHGSAIQDDRVPEKYLFERIDKKFEQSILDYEDFFLYFFKKSKYQPILDYNSFSQTGSENVSFSDNDKQIMFSGESKKLKIIQTPIKVNDNTDYLVSFEIKNNSIKNDYVNFDFYATGYDKIQQEASFPFNYPSVGFIQETAVINSGEVPENQDIYFRIFTYAEGSADVRNLEIYEINYSQ